MCEERKLDLELTILSTVENDTFVNVQLSHGNNMIGYYLLDF